MSAWTNWLSKLASTHPVSGLLILGSDHPDILQVQGLDIADSILLANGNPDLKDDCSELAERTDKLRFEAAVIGDGKAKAPFRALSLPGLSGVSEPDELFKLFPSVRQTTRRDVPTQLLKDLLAKLPTAEGKQRVVRTEVSGTEETLLQQLFALPEAAAPDHVFLRMPEPGLYTEDRAHPDIAALTENTAYTLEARSEDDPDFPEYWLRLDAQKIALRRKDAALEECKLALEQQRAEQQALSEQATTLSTENQNKIDQLSLTLKQSQDVAVQRGQSLIELKQALETRLQEFEALDTEAKQHLKQIHAMQLTLTQSQDTAVQRGKLLTEMDHVLKEERRSNAVLKQELATTKKTLEQTLAKLKERDQAAEQALALSTSKDAQLNAAKDALEKERQASTERVRELNETKVALERARAATFGREHELETARALQIEAQENAAQAAKQCAELQGELEKAKAAHTAGNKHNHVGGTAYQDAEKELSAKLASTKQEADAALRLQSMARGDIQDMRQRYEALRLERDAQALLLQDVIAQLDLLLPAKKTPKTTRKTRSTKAKSNG